MKKYKSIYKIASAMIIASMSMSYCVYGSALDGWSVVGEVKITKSSQTAATSPYNVADIKGVGEGGSFKLITSDGTLLIPIETPLYKVSDAYADRIVKRGGLWGVERNVEVITFDGSEDWAVFRQPAYKNDTTTVFYCKIPNDYTILNGIGTHFDVVLDKNQKNGKFDGVSFGRERGFLNLRILNVRGITTAESLKEYLKSQYDAQTPVKVMYPSTEPKFTPFEDEIQNKLKNISGDTIGFSDKSLSSFTLDEGVKANKDIFVNEKSGNDIMDMFLNAVTSAYIQNAPEGHENYYIEKLYSDKNSLKIIVKDNKGCEFKGEIEFSESDFLSQKPAEIILTGKGDEVIKLKVNLYKVYVPNNDIGSFSYKSTGIKNSCINSKEIVLPENVPVIDGLDYSIYTKNAVLYGSGNEEIKYELDNIELDTQKNRMYNSSPNDGSAKVYLDGNEYSFKWLSVDKNSGQGAERNILFLGDSIINQNYYTQYVSELFSNDVMKVNLLGTIGPEGNKHEGRGGWAAYDYCNSAEKYSLSNPFLNNNKFDFKYYMDKNSYESVDYVVLNLGINDLNMTEHNTHKEILENIDTIIKSIHSFDKNIKILINEPTVLYGDYKTNTAQNERLEFIKSLRTKYKDSEQNNIYTVPVYLGIDPDGGFKKEYQVIDEFNQDMSLKVTDTTHPNVTGYEGIAKMTYSYIKYIESSK